MGNKGGLFMFFVWKRHVRYEFFFFKKGEYVSKMKKLGKIEDSEVIQKETFQVGEQTVSCTVIEMKKPIPPALPGSCVIRVFTIFPTYRIEVKKISHCIGKELDKIASSYGVQRKKGKFFKESDSSLDKRISQKILE